MVYLIPVKIKYKIKGVKIIKLIIGFKIKEDTIANNQKLIPIKNIEFDFIFLRFLASPSPFP